MVHWEPVATICSTRALMERMWVADDCSWVWSWRWRRRSAYGENGWCWVYSVGEEGAECEQSSEVSEPEEREGREGLSGLYEVGERESLSTFWLDMALMRSSSGDGEQGVMRSLMSMRVRRRGTPLVSVGETSRMESPSGRDGRPKVKCSNMMSEEISRVDSRDDQRIRFCNMNVPSQMLCSRGTRGAL